MRARFGVRAGALLAEDYALETFSGETRADRIVAMVLPPFVLHFAADEPRRFLRFTFPTGLFPGNPRGTVEAVAFEWMAGAGFEPAKA